MCFVKKRKSSLPKIAAKDILVYKVMSKTFRSKKWKSYYQYFLYEPGKCYYENAFVKNVSKYSDIIHIGLHSYESKEKAYRAGFSYNYIVPCIIPEGAKYLYNSDNETYVSDYLIIGTYKDSKRIR